ncbi:MAG: glycosyl hydrolase family 28-related protein [Syntrophobacteraceae bacterium]|nr:glycosyl hydrolase family 28-related protein [Syntrophobacteraceae bacterium]
MNFNNQTSRGKTIRNCVIVLAALALPAVFSQKALAVYSLPASRVVNWSTAGVTGGIPSRTTIYKTIQASSYGAGSTDATSAINSALSSCPAGQVVVLSSGAFKIAGTIKVPSNVTLRGSGPQSTILSMTGKGIGIQIGTHLAPYGTTATSSSNAVALSSGYTKGSSSVVLNGSLSGLAAGSLVWLSELNDSSVPVTPYGGGGKCTWCDDGLGGTRNLGQIVRVTSVSGKTIGIDPPMNTTYNGGLSPLAILVTNSPTHDAGVEALQVYDNNSGRSSNFSFQGAYNCWIENVESNYSDADHVDIDYSTHVTVADSYFHDSFVHTAGTSDSELALETWSSANLIQNNVFRRLHCSVMLRDGVAGNVTAYNYFDGDFDSGSTTVLMYPIGFHGAHPEYNLFEGNVANMVNDDSIWGSSSDETYFRNWFVGTTLICSPINNTRGTVSTSPVGTYGASGVKAWWANEANRPMAFGYLSTANNMAGNVVGSTQLLNLMKMTKMVVWAKGVSRAYSGTAYGYSMGFGGSGAGDSGTYSNCGSSGYPGSPWCSDNTEAYTTGIIQGDYSYADGSTNWGYGGYKDPNSSDHVLPSSLYLSGKPAFFGSTAFPAIGPDVTGGNDTSGHVHTIPAQACYAEGKMPNCLATSSPSSLTAPSGVRLIGQ